MSKHHLLRLYWMLESTCQRLDVEPVQWADAVQHSQHYCNPAQMRHELCMTSGCTAYGKIFNLPIAV